MRRIRSVGIGAMVAACGSVGGEPDAGGPADAIPAGTRTLAIERASIGATTTRAPLPLAGLSARYLVEDPAAAGGLRVVPTLVDGTSWTAELPAGRAAIEFTLPDRFDPVLHLYDLAARDVAEVFAPLEHADPAPAPAGASLDIGPLTLDAAYDGAELQFLSIGTWVAYNFFGAERPDDNAATWNPPPFSYALTIPLGGTFDAITPDDDLLVLRNRGSRLVAWTELSPITMDPGVNLLSATAPLVSLEPLPLSTDGRVDAMTARARLDAPEPGFAAPSTEGLFVIVAAPAAELLTVTGPYLASGAIATDANDVPLQVSYANPFVGTPARDWQSLLLVEVRRSRRFESGGRFLELFTSLFAKQPPPTDGADVELNASLPTQIFVGDTALVVDERDLPLPADAPVELTFALDGPPCTLYHATLSRLVPHPSAADQWTRDAIYDLWSDQGRWRVPRTTFVDGERYNLRAVCVQGGYPGVGDGDLRTRSAPQAIGYTDGAVFTVSTP